MSDLARSNQHHRVEIQVETTARPESGLLQIARQKVQQESRLTDLFKDSKSSGSKIDRRVLADLLQEVVPASDPLDVQEVAIYLADEYEQIGDGILLISSKTGKAVARLRDEDFYHANMVPREHGTMVDRGVKLRPEVEAFIVQWIFDSDRDEELKAKVLSRTHQTGLVRETGDPRLLSVTKHGRQTIVERVQDRLPQVFEQVSGVARAFFDFFPLQDEGVALEGEEIIVEGAAKVRRGVQDPLTHNLRYDHVGATLALTATSWVRSCGTALLTAAKQRPRDGKSFEVEELLSHFEHGMWIAEPNLARVLQDAGLRVLPAPGPENLALHLSRPCGSVVVAKKSFQTTSLEVHDRWTVQTLMSASLRVQWDELAVVPVSGSFVTGVGVEIL